MDEDKFIRFASLLEKVSRHPDNKVFASKEEEEEYRRLAYLWEHCPPARTKANEAVWAKVSAKMVAEHRKERRHRWIYALKYGAAAAVVAALIGFMGWNYFHQQPVEDWSRIARQLETSTNDADVKQVTLVVADRQQIALRNNAQVTYSSTGQASVDQQQVTTEKSSQAYSQLLVPKGKRSQLILSDQSKVWVNAGSKVIYPATFEGNTREIFVEGEAYLEVSRNEKKPFIVHAGGFKVRVLGTAFNISAYPHTASKESSVVLVQGSVDVVDTHNRHLNLSPDERVLLTASGIESKQHVHAADYIRWTQGVMQFDGEPLHKVLQRLQDYYGVTLGYPDTLSDQRICGNLYLDEDLNKVLRALSSLLKGDGMASKVDSIYIIH